MAQLDGIGLDDAEQAARTFQARSSTENGNWFNAYVLHHYALNRGRPAEALRFAKKIQVFRPVGILRWQLPVLDATFSDGDPAAAERAARQLSQLARRLEGMRSEQASQARHGALCTADLWRLHKGDVQFAQATIVALREPPAGRAEAPATATQRLGCATVLETLLALREDPATPLTPLEELAEGMQAGHLAWDAPHVINLLLARLYEERGDLHGALAAVRRRPYHTVDGIPFLSTFLREEGRLAALTGDTTAAIRAYRHYLELRSAPEPALAGRIAQVRAALAELEAIDPISDGARVVEWR